MLEMTMLRAEAPADGISAAGKYWTSASPGSFHIRPYPTPCAPQLARCRFLARNGHAEVSWRCPLLGEQRKTYARIGLFRFWTHFGHRLANARVERMTFATGRATRLAIIYHSARYDRARARVPARHGVGQWAGGIGAAGARCRRRGDRTLIPAALPVSIVGLQDADKVRHAGPIPVINRDWHLKIWCRLALPKPPHDIGNLLHGAHSVRGA
jgi:hypothetical protein